MTANCHLRYPSERNVSRGPRPCLACRWRSSGPIHKELNSQATYVCPRFSTGFLAFVALALDLLRLFLLNKACHCSSGPPPVRYYALKSVCVTEEKWRGNLNLNPQANSLANCCKNPQTSSRSTRLIQIHRTRSDPQDSSKSTDSFKIHKLLRIHGPGSPVISRRSQSSTDDLRLDLPPPDLSRSAQLQTIANTNSVRVLI
jgi:hypothetical protein